MEWNSKDQSEWEVVDRTGWRNRENFGTIEDRSGVYILANIDLHIKYIGKAGAGRLVTRIKEALSEKKGYGATRVKVLYTNSDDKAISLKKKLIAKYDPVNNK